MQTTTYPQRTEQIEYLADYSTLDQKWDFNKSANDMVSRYYRESDYQKYYERTKNCASRLGFRLKGDSEGNQQLKLKSVFLCHVRLCPICQTCRTRIHKRRLNQAIPLMRADNPSEEYIFLTLTQRNCNIKDLRDTLRAMSRAFNNLAKRKEFNQYVTGYFRSTEVTKSEIYEAHPHFHLLLSVKPSYFKRGYVLQERWCQLWKEAMRLDYIPVCHVEKVHLTGTDKQNKRKLTKTIAEVAKYMVKPTDLIGKGNPRDKDFFIELTNQIHGTKQLNSSGTFKKYLKEIEPTEEEILQAVTDDELDVVKGFEGELYFNWFYSQKKYGKFS